MRRRMPAVVAAAVMATSLTTPVAVSADERGDPPSVAGSTADERSASAKAAATGERVEIPALTDERSRVFAEPDGSFTLEQSAVPERVRTAEGWTPVDTTLATTGSGMVRPKASSAEVEFSGGGDAPMARVGLGSKAVELDWPGELPAPTLEEDRATYADVLPDVDLVLTAGTDGFSQVLVVKTRKAAQNPDLAELELALGTEGVRMRADAAGNLDALGDKGGESVFTASAPAMWDSAGQDVPEQEKASRPAAGARTALVRAEVEPASIKLVPDAAMLDDPETEFPVFIDPSVSVSRKAWAYVNRKYPSQAYYNRSEKDTGVGYEPQYGNTKRAFWRFSVYKRTRKATTTIQRATLRMKVTHAFGCTDATFRLYRTSGISSKTTWNRQPSKSKFQDKVNVDKGRPACGGKGVEFDATEAYKWGAKYDKSSVTLGLYGNETRSGSNWDWRRFAKDPKLVVRFNNKPAQPDTGKMSDSHGGVCSTDPKNPRLINTKSPTFRAYVRDYDSHWYGQKLKTRFEWKIGGKGDRVGYVDTAYKDVAKWPKGSYYQARAKDLPEGELLGYRAIAHDRTVWGYPWSDWCYIKVDTTNPETGPEVTSQDYPEGDEVSGTVGKSGAFTFSANGVKDAAAYHYSVNDASCSTKLTPKEPGGSVSAVITPSTSGPNLIHARTTDAHGNSSECVLVYTFTVAEPSHPVAYFPVDEGSGGTSGDAIQEGRNVTASGGVDWTRGRVGSAEYGSYRLNGTAVRTDGTDGRLSTDGPVVDTSRAFSVAAWVRLDDPSRNHTAVAQEGEWHSGFYLGYNHRGGNGSWVFKQAPSDDTDSAAVDHRVYSKEPAKSGAWTHLLGTFDPASGELALYVDGVKQGTTVQGTPWNADGPLVIGGAKFKGEPYDPWPGAIDDVRVWDRVVMDEALEDSGGRPETWKLANRPTALEGRWELDESAGTSVADSSDHGLTGTLHGDPDSAWGGAENDHTFSPGVTLNGKDERITTEAPAIRTDRSFSVAAWVRLDETNTNSTAVSQDGTNHSGFYLGQQNTYDWDNWVLKMAPSDEVGAKGWSRALSEGSPELGLWTHLAATYDYTTGEMTLYVDGVKEGTDVQKNPWNANGALVIGAAQFEERLTGAWGGDIDDVHVYQGVLNGAEVAQVRGGSVGMT
ncbi:LamG domain-containing protein [Nocardiopsis rhodophaea]|uniref:LamG domain-containing protein n=1 Tax=Nocardiopsis rhodophaea TaxID=280238 RepID=A0ABP5EK75_9ACTN